MVIPPQAKLPESIRLQCTSSDHITVDAGEGAQATVVITIDAKEEAQCEIHVHAATGSSLTVIVIQHPSKKPLLIQQRGRTDERATIRWQNVTLGGKAVTHDLRSEVTGADAKSVIEWVCMAKDDEKCTLSMQNVFLAARGGGEITMKAVAEGHAHVTAHGSIEIGPNGGGTDTYLTQNVLMLDPTARVDAVPALEIKTNDVKASHAASIARVTPEDLFYLSSRGIPKTESRKMFVEGFLNDMVINIQDASLREEIVVVVGTK